MAIWTAVWGQVSTDKQHTSCHCCSPLTIQTVEGSVAAGPDEWSSSLWQAGLVQILQGSAKYTQVSLPWNTENGDLHSLPLLALYSCNFLSWSWFTPYLEACALIHHPSAASPRLLPPCSQARSLFWPPVPGSAVTQQGWAPATQGPALPGHRSWSLVHPQAHVLVCLQPWTGVSNAQELGRGEDEIQWSISSSEPCPGMGGTKRLLTANTNLQILPDQFNWLL